MRRSVQLAIGGLIVAAILIGVAWQGYRSTVFYYTPGELLSEPERFGLTVGVAEPFAVLLAFGFRVALGQPVGFGVSVGERVAEPVRVRFAVGVRFAERIRLAQSFTLRLAFRERLTVAFSLGLGQPLCLAERIGVGLPESVRVAVPEPVGES